MHCRHRLQYHKQFLLASWRPGIMPWLSFGAWRSTLWFKKRHPYSYDCSWPISIIFSIQCTELICNTQHNNYVLLLHYLEKRRYHRSLKIVEFFLSVFQAWKVLENRSGPWNWKSLNFIFEVLKRPWNFDQRDSSSVGCCR